MTPGFRASLNTIRLRGIEQPAEGPSGFGGTPGFSDGIMEGPIRGCMARFYHSQAVVSPRAYRESRGRRPAPGPRWYPPEAPASAPGQAPRRPPGRRPSPAVGRGHPSPGYAGLCRVMPGYAGLPSPTLGRAGQLLHSPPFAGAAPQKPPAPAGPRGPGTSAKPGRCRSATRS